MATTTKQSKKMTKAPAGNAMEATVYAATGKEVGSITLPENIFGLPWNADLVHQVVSSMNANARVPVAHTKTRGEVRGGGKKPWQQKGTGRARHGSSRSPIWVGGGITHGPRNDKVYARKINRQMKQKALLVMLSRKYKDGQVLFVDTLDMATPKTKEAKNMLNALSSVHGGLASRKNAALMVLPRRHEAVEKSFRNFGHVTVGELRNLNPVALLSSKYLVIVEPKSALEVLGSKKVAQ